MREAAVRARSAAIACAEAPAWSLPDAEVGATLLLVHQGEQALLAAKLHLLRELDARAVPGGGAAWLRDQARLSAVAARRLVALAAAVDARPGVDAALTAGAMHAEQAGAITTVLDDLPAQVGPQVVAKAEALLVGWAGEFAAPALRRLGERVLLHVAPDVAEQIEGRLLARAERRAYQARTVSLRKAGAGCYRLSGVLDAEAAAIVTAALDPLCRPRAIPPMTPTADIVDHAPTDATTGDAATTLAATGDAATGDAVPAGAVPAGAVPAGVAVADERSPGQRRADALVEVCRLALAGGDLPANGGDRPQVTVTVPFDPLTRLLGTATLDTGERITPAQARRLACDAELIPAVLDTAGQVLDLGRSRRLITGALRRALVLRDQGCTFPGCDRPPRWCDGHHIRSWIDGGPTRLDNAVLLCRHHHRTVHHDDWTIRLDTGGHAQFIPPAHLDPYRRPRRNIYHHRQ